MNTYIYAGGRSLLTMKDNDIKNFDTISNHYLNIDWAWVIEEDGTYVANEKEYDVKAGDVILVLYAGYREKEVPVKDIRKVRDFLRFPIFVLLARNPVTHIIGVKASKII